MKVTVQNGANHGLSRAEVEAMLHHLPGSWNRSVDAIVLYEHQEPEFRCRYYEKEKKLGLFWPSNDHNQPTKSKAVDEMLIALSAIANRGSLPDRLSASLRSQYLADAATVRAKCLKVVGEDAP